MTVHDTVTVLDELADIVGAGHVLTDPALTAGYETDWTGHWRGRAGAVVRPGDTGQVAAVLAACSRAGVPVVPQGGNTGLVGGSVPMHGELVLSTRRLDRIEGVDPVGRTIAAGAGVTVARAQQAARAQGLDLGIDLASRDSATLGGIVATNAGGIKVIRNGDTRSQLLGIEAVRSDGSVLTRWKELTKDNVGYDVPGLMAGSEGTLAVVTRVLMRLVVPAAHTQVALVGLRSVHDVLALVGRVQRRGLVVEAAELMTDAGIDLVCRHAGLRAPFAEAPPFCLLVEVSGDAAVDEALIECIESASETVLDATLETGPAQRLWEYRERHTETVSAASTTPPVKLDISTPLRAMAHFLYAVRSGLSQRFPDVVPVFFGHVADGNIHVNLLNVAEQQREPITDLVLHTVADHDGSISAEHGVGRAKAPWIELGRSAVDIDTMVRIRAAFDPAGLLNPHVLPSQSRVEGVDSDDRQPNQRR
jgi:FAD/FMN-containing dehydrogenase